MNQAAERRRYEDEQALRLGQIPPTIDLRLLLPHLPPSLQTFRRMLFALVAVATLILVVGMRESFAQGNDIGFYRLYLVFAALWALAIFMPKFPRNKWVLGLYYLIALLALGTILLIPLGVWMLRLLTRTDTRVWFNAADEAQRALQ